MTENYGFSQEELRRIYVDEGTPFILMKDGTGLSIKTTGGGYWVGDATVFYVEVDTPAPVEDDRTPYAGYNPILPNSDEEAALEQRVFDILYNARGNLSDSGQWEIRDLLQDLWREFVFRESWYSKEDKPKDWYFGYVDALKHHGGDCPPGGYKGPNGNPRTDYDFGWNAGFKASS